MTANDSIVIQQEFAYAWLLVLQVLSNLTKDAKSLMLTSNYIRQTESCTLWLAPVTIVFFQIVSIEYSTNQHFQLIVVSVQVYRLFVSLRWTNLNIGPTANNEYVKITALESESGKHTRILK